MTQVAHIVFDLDGTLVDTAPLCAAIVNDMLRDRGSGRRVSAGEARAFLTRGGADTVASLLGVDCGDVAAELADFRQRYAATPTAPDCLFPGVRAGLEELARLGIRTAICSNKPQHLCDKTVRDLCLEGIIQSVVGSRPGHALKPAADLAQLALADLGASPSDGLYVGDSEVDFLTAQAVGLPFVFATYGYAEAGWSPMGLTAIDRFADLVALVAPRLTQVA